MLLLAICWIIATAVYDEAELANYEPKPVYADANNGIARIGTRGPGSGPPDTANRTRPTGSVELDHLTHTQ